MKRIAGVALSFLLVLVILIYNVPVSAQDGKVNFAADHIIVKFKAGVDPAKHSKNITKHITALNAVLVKGSGPVQRQLDSFRSDSSVDFAEPDYIRSVTDGPNDPGLSNQWGLTTLGAPGAWATTTGSKDITIAIIDTGIDLDNEDLSSKVEANQNFGPSPTVDDLNGHGTHVAGIAAAVTNNGKGIAGVGYNSSLMNIKVMDDNGSGYDSAIADGITWAADNGADVINLSLGGPSASALEESAINYAWSKGVVIIASAGNNGNSTPFYPAYYANCIAVAATDQSDNKASFSNCGNWVDVASPGVNIYSTMPNHTNHLGGMNYGYLSGTSMSSPFVSGLAALAWTVSSSNTEVRNRIETRADQIAGTGSNWTFGRINAERAVSSSIPDVTTGTATGVTATSITLNGNLTSMGGSSLVPICFDYGTSLNYGSDTPYQTMTSTGPFSTTITTGLLPSTRYYFRARSFGTDTGYGLTNTFYMPPYSLVITANPGGTVSPSGTTWANIGQSKTVTMTANAGFHVLENLVDGKPAGPAGTYTFSNIRDNHTLSAFFSSGSLQSFGRDIYGALGNPSAGDQSTTPVEVCSVSGITKVSSGYSSTLALKSDGTVWAWGDNSFYVTGSSNPGYYYPTQVPGLTNIVDIAAGLDHYVVLKSNGTVWAWGQNIIGEVGDGTSTNRTTPVQVTGLTGIAAVFAGGFSSAALRSDGTVWSWGSGNYGQQGDGTTAHHYTPAQIPLSGVVSIAKGGFHTLLLKSDGTVWACGYNSMGQVGNGTTADQLVPVQVAGLSGIKSVAAGDFHSLAVDSAGNAWTWGYNMGGALGDGSTTNRSIPVKVLGGVRSVGGGGYHSFAVDNNNNGWVWGSNVAGELGDGTLINKYTPVQNTSLTNIKMITAGTYHTVALKNVPPPATVKTFGLDSGNRTQTVAANILNAMRFQNTAGTGTLTKLELLIDDTTVNGNARLGIYQDSNGKPGSLLLDAGAATVANGWISISGLSKGVMNNSYYWLVFDLQKPNNIRYQTGRASNSYYYMKSNYGNLPNSFSTSRNMVGNYQFIMRATVSSQ